MLRDIQCLFFFVLLEITALLISTAYLDNASTRLVLYRRSLLSSYRKRYLASHTQSATSKVCLPMSVLSRAIIGVLVFFCARVAGATSNGGFQLLQEAERYPGPNPRRLRAAQ